MRKSVPPCAISEFYDNRTCNPPITCPIGILSSCDAGIRFCKRVSISMCVCNRIRSRVGNRNHPTRRIHFYS